MFTTTLARAATVIFFTVLLGLVQLLRPVHAQNFNEVHFQNDKSLPEIFTLAAQEGKIIFIDFQSTGCLPCRMMDKGAFKNMQVALFFNQNFISYKADIFDESLDPMVLKYEVNMLPTLLFIKPDGSTLVNINGAKNSQELLNLGCEALNKADLVYNKHIDSEQNPCNIPEIIPDQQDVIAQKTLQTTQPYIPISKEMLLSKPTPTTTSKPMPTTTTSANVSNTPEPNNTNILASTTPPPPTKKVKQPSAPKSNTVSQSTVPVFSQPANTQTVTTNNERYTAANNAVSNSKPSNEPPNNKPATSNNNNNKPIITTYYSPPINKNNDALSKKMEDYELEQHLREQKKQEVVLSPTKNVKIATSANSSTNSRWEMLHNDYMQQTNLNVEELIELAYLSRQNFKPYHHIVNSCLVVMEEEPALDFQFIYDFATSYDNNAMHYLIGNAQEMKMRFGSDETNERIRQVVLSTVYQAIEEQDESILTQALQIIDKAQLPYSEHLKFELESSYFQHTRDWESYFSLSEAFIQKQGNTNPDILNKVSGICFRYIDNKRILKKALQFAEQAVNIEYSYQAHLNYAALLCKLERFEEAKKAANTAYKLSQKEQVDNSELLQIINYYYLR